MLKISIVVGNPKPNSRTGRISTRLIENIVPQESCDIQFIELANYADDLFKWPSQVMADLNKTVAKSDLAVFASPTYKATFTGMLKAFLDRYPANGLKNVIALPVMTGAGPGHSMAPNVSLIPLLLELGATVPVSGIYFNTSMMDQAEDVVAAHAREIVASLTSLSLIVQAVAGQVQTQDAKGTL